MLKKDSKTQLLDHSEAKVRLLSEYLIRYLNIIANSGRTKKIKIYDLFCGEGVYENGGEGSPLIIMRAVKDLHFINVAKINEMPKIDCFFNDINKDKVEKVKQAIKNKSLYYPEFGSLEFSSDDYKKVVERVLKELTQSQNQKAFIFIDPYGYKHIKASEIKQLLKENAEVLLFLPTQFMYRFDANGTPEALKDFIEELIDYKNWSETDSVWSFIEQLKSAFGIYLGEDFFVDTFTIQKDPQTVFCLFFFSSHIKGFEKMLEAKWKIDTEQGKGWDYTADSQQSLFQSQKTNPLEEKLNIFLKDKSRNNKEIYEFILHNGFLPTHCVDVFSSWQKNGKLKVENIKGEKIRDGWFYIAYKYFRDEPNKVNFTLK